MARQMTTSAFHKSKTLDNKYVRIAMIFSRVELLHLFFFLIFFFLLCFQHFMLILYWLQMLGDEIGKGAYGRVYKGLDLENGDFVAIKQVSLENIAQEDLNIIMVSFFF